MQRPAAKVVLIVDDEFAIVEALAEILTWEGYVVKSAAHGRAALQILATDHVDVVLMDLMMPVMGGVEAATAMRSDPRLRTIPVVVMSAGPLPDGDSRWSEAIRKPFDLDALLGAIKRAVEAPPPDAARG